MGPFSISTARILGRRVGGSDMSFWRLEDITADDALDALYAFWYRIYVEEMARPQKYADHATRRIRDPLDDRGYNIVAWDAAGQISGCF